MSIQDFLAYYTEQLIVGSDGIVSAIEDLNLEELHFRAGEATNSIGFSAWHVLRTADNVVNFVCLGVSPVWRQQRLDQAWGLPRNAQGTGMDPTEAQAMRFPSVQALAQYGRDVANTVVPALRAMTDELLDGIVTVVPHGDLPRVRAIGKTIVTHGNVHLGEINLARTLIGRPSLGF